MIPLLPAAIVTGKAPGFLMVGSAALMAFIQEATTTVPETMPSTVMQFAAMLLGVGGIGYLLIKTGANEYSKTKEQQRERDREDRAQERAEDERRYVDHKELSARLINTYDGQVQALRQELTEVRASKDRLTEKLIGKES